MQQLSEDALMYSTGNYGDEREPTSPRPTSATSNSFLRFPARQLRRSPLVPPRGTSVRAERTMLPVLNRRVEVIGARGPVSSQ